MFFTIVHQTLEDSGNPEYIEDHGPFPGDPTGRLYLGNGTYFWDDHIDLAHWWGSKHIDGNYVICSADFKLRKTEFLDLVGCRQDMIHLKEMIDQLDISHLKLGEIIEYIKKIGLRKPDFFPYKAIRAVDNAITSYTQHWISFAPGKTGTTSLTPAYIICLIKKSDVILSSYRIIFPQEYVNGD